MQRIEDMTDAQRWGKHYNVFSQDLNGDNLWTGAAAAVGDTSEFFIMPRTRDHYAHLKRSLVYWFNDKTLGLDQNPSALPAFEWATGLAMAAKAHITETAAESPARRSNLGTHGSSPATRAATFGTWEGQLTEYIVYGRNDAIGAIVELLAHDHGYLNDALWANAVTNTNAEFDDYLGSVYKCSQNPSYIQSAAY